MSTGLPAPIVKWERNGIEIKPSPSKISSMANGVLKILDAEPDDIGLYICNVSNGYHQAIGNITLNVHCK